MLQPKTKNADSSLASKSGFFSLLFLTGLLVNLQSCGRPSDPYERIVVSGVVHVNGKPLEQGRITFVPMEGNSGPVAGSDINNGRFQTSREQGPGIGQYRVKVIGIRKTGRMVPGVEGSGSENDSNAMTAEIKQFLPPEYNEKTTLTVEITEASSQDLKFELSVPES